MIVASMTLFAVPALAGGPHHRGHKKKGPMFMNPKMLDRVAERINLDDTTLESIKAKVYEGKKAKIDLKAELDSKKLDLRHELDSQNPDRGKVMNLIDETGALHTKLKKLKIGLMLEIRSMLSPQQIKQMKKLRREFRGKHHRSRGDRKHRAGGRYLDKQLQGKDH